MQIRLIAVRISLWVERRDASWGWRKIDGKERKSEEEMREWCERLISRTKRTERERGEECVVCCISLLRFSWTVLLPCCCVKRTRTCLVLDFLPSSLLHLLTHSLTLLSFLVHFHFSLSLFPCTWSFHDIRSRADLVLLTGISKIRENPKKRAEHSREDWESDRGRKADMKLGSFVCLLRGPAFSHFWCHYLIEAPSFSTAHSSFILFLVHSFVYPFDSKRHFCKLM